jgi:uroporphyrinogen decarboxylase
MYDQYFAEGVGKFCKTVHSYGGKVIMHSCGYTMNLVPKLIELGIDALHPWEPTAGMDIFEGKKKFGDKLCLIGNVNLETLTRGTQRDVVNEVKTLMQNCSPGGGYILSSAHSVVPSCKWDNYIAMLWAAKKFGRY